MPDYSQTASTTENRACPDADIDCLIHGDCRQYISNPADYPAAPPPLPNSHLDSEANNMIVVSTCRYCERSGAERFCRAVGTFTFQTIGQYSCDEGYSWNGSACVLPSGSLPLKVSLFPLWIMKLLADQYKKKQRKKRLQQASQTL